MRTPFRGPAFAAAAIVAAGGLLAAGIALRPAFAGAAGPSPDGTVKCSSASPCQIYKNSGMGPALQGVSGNNKMVVDAITGTAGTFGNGVNGFAGSSGNGVNGQAGNTGVNGTGGTWGVFGFSSLSGGTGVEGQSDNGTGVVGFSSCCDGMSTASSSGNGLFSLSESSAASISSLGGLFDSITSTASAGSGAVAYRGVNDGDNGSDGNGADITGSYIGVIARNVAGQNFPLLAVDTNGTDLMYVDSAGNVNYHGSLIHFSNVRGGMVARTYGAQSASPTIEDNGTAQLVGGEAVVQLDSAFAHSIDVRRPYQVMLTPDGDTRGLYIASKSATSFEVREVQGGRNTLAFDYHIYAPGYGQAGVRMTELSPSIAAATMPHAPYIVQKPHAKPVFRLRPTH
jgi:hypothetical protein